MLTEADMIRIMAENYGRETYDANDHIKGNSLTKEDFDEEIDDSDPYEHSRIDASSTGEYTC